MTDPQPTRLEAFDANGIHFGSATFGRTGWTVRIGKRTLWRKSQELAEEELRKAGARTITEESGLKR